MSESISEFIFFKRQERNADAKAKMDNIKQQLKSELFANKPKSTFSSLLDGAKCMGTASCPVMKQNSEYNTEKVTFLRRRF